MKRILILLIALTVCVGCTAPVLASTSYSDDEILASLYEAELSDIIDALDAGIITSRQLTEYYLDRIEEFNDTYNCFITLCDDAIAMATVRDIERQHGADGVLLGVPIIIKDNMDYEGYETTNGYGHNGIIEEENADIVQKLLDAGAVIIGKANMSEGADSAKYCVSDTVGETYNAYNPLLSACGSSGGSAVSVSLNFAPAALGTDTNSSLRLPAAVNGCVSMRCTFGLLSNDGIDELNGDRDTPGVITKTVKDQALMLSVLTDNDYYINLNGSVLDETRLGVLTELIAPTNEGEDRSEDNIDEEILDGFYSCIDDMESSGATIIEVVTDDLFYLSDRCDGWNGNKNKFKEYLTKIMDENDLDGLIFPTYLSTPNEAQTNDDKEDYAFINNCYLLSSTTGMPEISVQIGNHSKGSGIGLEILGRENDEQTLLNIAYSYQREYNHRTAPDGAPNLYTGTVSLEEILTPAQTVFDSFYETVENVEKSVNIGTVLASVATLLILVPLPIIIVKKKAE